MRDPSDQNANKCPVSLNVTHTSLNDSEPLKVNEGVTTEPN